MELKIIPITSIASGERFRLDYGDTALGPANISALVESIKKEGIIQPLAVKQTSPDTYQLLAGGRRLVACDKAGITDIPVRIYPETLTDLEMRSIELMENICRKDLDWLEAAELKNAINELQKEIYGEKKSTAIDAEGWSERDTADLLGISHTSVSQDINLARATKVFPGLKQAKNKNEALKMLKKLQTDVVQEEIAKRLAERRAVTPLDRQLLDLSNRYIVKDFFEGIREVPDKSIDLVEMDPPYGIDLQNLKKHDNIDIQLHDQYNEVPAEEYLVFMSRVIRECHRVMSENSWLIVWYAMEPWSEMIYHLINNAGFRTRRLPGIWVKGEGQLQCQQPNIYLASGFEPFFYATKGHPTIVKQGRSNVFHFRPVQSQYKCHPTERPVELIQEILTVFGWENARILVPFLGSGNTLLAASNLGMQAFGYDLVNEYKASYIVRVHEGRPGQYKSYRGGVDDVPF